MKNRDRSGSLRRPDAGLCDEGRIGRRSALAWKLEHGRGHKESRQGAVFEQDIAKAWRSP